MTREELLAVTKDAFAAFRSKLSNAAKEVYEKAKDQIDPTMHEVITDKLKRPDKTIKVESEDEHGDKKTTTKTVYVARLALSLQKLIVKRAAAFLTGNPIGRIANTDIPIEESLIEVFEKTWEDNKLDFKTSELARLMMSETECAELWYTEQVDPEYWEGTANAGKSFRLRVRILANSKGDSLFPIFDPYGDMIAFGREYKIRENDKDVTYFDLYTDEKISHYRKGGDGWEELPGETNIIGKIPVIYYKQDAVEWADVQTLIDRLETMISNYADTVDYFGSPMLKARGYAFSLPEKAGVGKTVQVTGTKEESDVDYLTWDMKPEAVIFEFETMLRQIYTLTQTPDISFESMKGLGQFSGIALKLLFMDAHLKAHEHWGQFGECIARRMNYIKTAMSKINLSLKPAMKLIIKPEFKPYMPLNEQEVIELLGQAVTDGILSTESAVERNPLATDKEVEKKRLKDQRAAEVPDPLDNAA